MPTRWCPKCGAENLLSSGFCEDCGSALAPNTAPSTSTPRTFASDVRVAAESSSPENLEGERKTVTALFADIKGSTELEQDLDPEEARAIVDPALKLMIDAVQRYDGYVVQSTGDGRAGGLNKQGGKYHVVVRGFENGQVVDRVEECASIGRAVHAGTQWDEVLKLATSPDLKVVNRYGPWHRATLRGCDLRTRH